MASVARQGAAGRAMGRGVVLAALLVLSTPASAGGGIGDFLGSIFGGGSAPAEAPQRAMPEAPAAAPVERHVSRPLTVKLRHPRLKVARLPSAPGKVSIYEDTTLRRGDAVMTAKGMRVFAGSRSWPYKEADFIAVSEAQRLGTEVRKTLLVLDTLPRR